MYADQQMTAREIAPLVGYSASHVSKLVRQAGLTRKLGPRPGHRRGGARARTAEAAWAALLERSAWEGECLVWQGTCNRAGYGRFVWGRVRGAHRASYVIHHGPLKKGQHVMHACDNPSCINPAHLTAGSPADNVADCVAKDRQACGERQGLSKMTWDKVRALRERYDAGETQVSLSAAFGISQPTVSQIVRRVTWRADGGGVTEDLIETWAGALAALSDSASTVEGVCEACQYEQRDGRPAHAPGCPEEEPHE